MEFFLSDYAVKLIHSWVYLLLLFIDLLLAYVFKLCKT